MRSFPREPPHIRNAAEEGGATCLGPNKHATFSVSKMQALNVTGYDDSVVKSYESDILETGVPQHTLQKAN